MRKTLSENRLASTEGSFDSPAANLAYGAN